MNIGEKIDYFIFKQGISQKKLANDLNIATTTLNGYIKNKRQPSYDTLVSIADYFNVSCDYLLNHNTNDLSTQDITLVKSFNCLSKNQKELILIQIQTMNKQNSR